MCRVRLKKDRGRPADESMGTLCGDACRNLAQHLQHRHQQNRLGNGNHGSDRPTFGN